MSAKAEAPHPKREVAVFWDYENVQLPPWFNAADAAKSMVQVVSMYGRIVERRLYFDFANWGSPRDCSALDSSGFDLVNTPRRKQKETLDKKLIADMLTFAWDSTSRNPDVKPCVVLLTSDGDYAYTLSKLRDRGVMSVVMTGKDCTVAQILVDNADTVLSFETDVLGLKTEQTREKSLVSPGARASTTTASKNESDISALIEAINRHPKKLPDGWCTSAGIGLAFRATVAARPNSFDGELPDIDYKSRFQKARDHGIKAGLVEVGRRQNTPESTNRGVCSIIPVSILSEMKIPAYLSTETYIRLLNKTNRRAEGLKNAPEGSARYLFVKNLPRMCNPQTVFDFFEQRLICPLRVAELEFDSFNPNASYCFAQVECRNVQDAKRVLSMTRSGLTFGGRLLTVMVDTRILKRTREDTQTRERNDSAVIAPSGTASVASNTTTSLTPDPLSDVTSFCMSVFKEQRQRLLSREISDGWSFSVDLGIGFRKQIFGHGMGKDLPTTLIKNRYKKARSDATASGFVEMGRGQMGSSKPSDILGRKIICVSGPRAAKDPPNFNLESYARLTSSGLILIESHLDTKTPLDEETMVFLKANAQNIESSNLLLKNLPPMSDTQELVCFFEQKLSCPVSSATLQLKHPSDLSCSVNVELKNVEDALKVMSVARSNSKAGLVYAGRIISVALDSKKKTSETSSDDAMPYPVTPSATTLDHSLPAISVKSVESEASELTDHIATYSQREGSVVKTSASQDCILM